MKKSQFEWDTNKDNENQEKHGIPFSLAQYAFADPRRIIAEDIAHSETEKRYFCFGEVDDGILTVRFTYRNGLIRIFGAGYWRKGKAIYERENQIHQ
ncbi:MAG: BrnT family toxin [Gallionella sp.]|nr:BrnT family toxin [Gallionella sp.]